MTVQRFYIFLISFCFFVSCKKSVKDDNQNITIIDSVLPRSLIIKGIDASFLPEVRQSGIITKNRNGVAEDMLTTLKNNGVNTIRMRLWKNPATIHSSFGEVKTLAQEVKNAGLKVWICLHYSDTWADPGFQQKPAQWASLSFANLKDSVYAYTKKIVAEINPDYIQIGNEINNGFLWPQGNFNNASQMIDLIKQGAKAVRDNSTSTKIMLHYAGHENAASFFSLFTGVDYDIIGLSYYPIWHGKNVDNLQTNLNVLGNQFNKDILIAETAYPFTFGYNDYSNNIIGDATQILPQYEATPQGQLAFLLKIKAIVTSTPKGIGFCYWGGEWISRYGPTATNGSSYENQALWDFSNTTLPAMAAFYE
jgi:arabinogalactan endo-1,4-beta-galactosidase